MPSNFFIPPGPDAPADLMARMRDGLWIQSLRPAPSMPPSAEANGLLAALATGRRVTNGEPGEAISGVLVAWPISGLMSGIVGVGNDLGFGFPAGSFGSPSLLVSEIGLRAS
jgi:predicted Zn-dependent protease